MLLVPQARFRKGEGQHHPQVSILRQHRGRRVTASARTPADTTASTCYRPLCLGACRVTYCDMGYYTLHEVRIAKREILAIVNPWDLTHGTQLYGRHDAGLAPMLFTVEEIRGEHTDAVVAKRLTYGGAQVEIPDLVE